MAASAVEQSAQGQACWTTRNKKIAFREAVIQWIGRITTSNEDNNRANVIWKGLVVDRQDLLVIIRTVPTRLCAAVRKIPCHHSDQSASSRAGCFQATGHDAHMSRHTDPARLERQGKGLALGGIGTELPGTILLISAQGSSKWE